MNLILFSFFKNFNLAALCKSSPLNALGVHSMRGRNAHNRVKRKQLLLRWRRIVLFLETLIISGSLLFSVVIICFCSCSSSVLVCVHAFPGAVICDLQWKAEGKQKQFVGLNFRGFLGGIFLSFRLCFFFFVAFTSLGEQAVVL